MLQNKKIFITGGAGYLGRSLVARFYEHNDITVYSRDEAKHYFLKKEFPNIRCVVGSITDRDRLIRSSEGHNIGIFAASLKQISACDENPIESINTICLGAINSRLAAEDNEFEAACFISTDKACEASTIYGSCKHTAEQSFIVNNSSVRLSSCRYGNVTNSTGSIIPLILDSIKKIRPLSLCSTKMTRFIINIDEAVDLVEYSLLKAAGVVVVPKLRSFLVKDLFDLYSKHSGLQYIIGNPRIGEKIHEIMVGSEETNRTFISDKYFFISPKNFNNANSLLEAYSSDKHVMSSEELYTNLRLQNLI